MTYRELYRLKCAALDRLNVECDAAQDEIDRAKDALADLEKERRRLGAERREAHRELTAFVRSYNEMCQDDRDGQQVAAGGAAAWVGDASRPLPTEGGRR